MEATYNSNDSVFSIVTKVAALLSQDEKDETDKTAATVAVPSSTSITKTRTKIFESLLKSRLPDNPISSRLDVLPQCQKLLDEQATYLSLNLGNNITHCLQNVYKCKEDQEYNQNQNEQEPKRESVVGKQNTMMMAWPLRLESNPGFEEHSQISFHPSNRTLLRSFENMRKSLKPVCFRRKADFNLCDIGAIRSFQKNQKKSILCCSALKDSLSRIKESRRRSRHAKVNLPLWEIGKDDDKSDDSDRLTLPLSLEKHFVSDQIVSNELKWHVNRTLELIFIDLSLLIDHLKKAAAGLQSETIACQDDGSFKLKPNITLSTILPELLAEFAEPFLISGRAFRRLSARTQWHHVENHVERPLNRTLRHAVITLLSNCRLFLLSLPAKNLSQLLHGAGPTMKMIQQIDLMFQDEEDMNNAEGMKKICGLNIMRFLCSFINVNTDSQFSQLLIYLLKSLCETYFAQLQRWIYHGELEEPFNELFVRAHKVANEQSREFFERAYYIRSEAVPGFLEGCEQAILQCGKYNRFLKNYNPQHPVFSLKYPKMVVCLSELQISRMREQLELHNKQIVENIEPFDIKSMFKKQKENSERFGNRMWDCTQAYIAAWQAEQQELQLKANEQKQRRYEELNEQRAQQEQLQMEQKRLEIMLELEFQQKREKLEERRLLGMKKALREHVNAVAATMEVRKSIDISPDESTSSSRSFVSCEEPDLEILKEKAGPELLQTTNQTDMLNSNKCDSELARNRMRNNSSEQFQECQMQVELLQVPTTSIIRLTEAERNRMRVLNCSEEQMGSKLPPDMNMNLEDLSDMQRNRQRMQQHNPFSSENIEAAATVGPDRRFMKSNTEQDLNCQRVKGGDFKGTDCLGKPNLNLPLELQKLCVESTLEAGTPMSTTSDVDVEEAIPVEVDAVNNNNVTSNTNSESPITAAAAEPEPETEPEPEPEPKLKPEPQPEPDAKRTQKPTFSFPIMRTDVNQQVFGRIEKIDQKPFIIKGYMQLSVVAPLQLHLSLLCKEVLRIFHEKNIFEYFCDLRKYFFLLDGEFGTLLINGILEQIESGVAPNILCQKSVLDTILNNAMGNRVNDGPTSAQIMDNLELNCSNIPTSFDLMDINVLSILRLDCKMEWPLNLVFSVETMEKYAQIFSYLVKLRHVSFVMDRAYVSFQGASRRHGRELQKSSQYRHLQMIRHKLSHFVNTLQNHLVTNALEGTWKSFTDGLNNVESIEGLYQRHVDYLKEIAFFALLNRRSAKFRETIDNILMIALRFCKILDSKSFLLDEKNQFVHPRYKRLVYEEAELEKFIRYAIYLGIKVAASGYQEKIVDLIRIINYNGYYNVSDSTNEIK